MAVTIEADLPIAIDVSAIHPTSGGAGTYVRQLVAHLLAAGIAPTLIARRNDREPWTGAASVRRSAPGSRPVRLLWEQLALPRKVERDASHAAILHSPHYTMPYRLHSIPRVVTVHDMTFFTDPASHLRSKRLLFRRAIRAAARSADALICVSRTTAVELERLLAPHVPITVIPHGVDLTRFTALRADDDDERLEALGVRPPYVLHLGAIEPRKNIPALVRAYASLVSRGEHQGTTLVLAGKRWTVGAGDGRGGSVDAMDATAHLSGLSAPGAVLRLGFVNDASIPALLRNAAVVAYPSTGEGFGLPALEALACGAPVVTSRGTAMEEVLGDAAVLVDPTDDESIAGGIITALRGDAPSRTVRLERAGRYPWSATAAAHAALYRRLAGR